MQNDKKQNKEVSALILAAGNSSRMGFPKFMLRFDQEFTFLEKIVDDYRNFGCKEIVVVLNSQGAGILKNGGSKITDFVQIATNPHPEKERLLSIQIGLKALNNPEKVFIHPVDNPFVDHSVLQILLENSSRGDYQVPSYYGKGGHPILISNKIIKNIVFTNNPNLHFKSFLKYYTDSYVNVNISEVLFNINSPIDYLEYQNKMNNLKNK